jgi:hypothetical protein
MTVNINKHGGAGPIRAEIIDVDGLMLAVNMGLMPSVLLREPPPATDHVTGSVVDGVMERFTCSPMPIVVLLESEFPGATHCV